MLYICINKNKQILKVMNTELKNKVEALLIRRGNNVDDVKEMVSLHFELGSKFYTSVKTISDYIRTVY